MRYTPQQMEEMFAGKSNLGISNTPSTPSMSGAPKRYTPQEMESMMGGGSPSSGIGQPTQVKKPAFIEALATQQPNYIPGKTYNNISEGMKDFSVGATKSVLSLPVHMAQFMAGLVIGKENLGDSYLNTESNKGQYLNQSLKGNTGAQKWGKTVTDVGTIFAPGKAVPVVGAATSTVTKSLPFLANTASRTGLKGMLSRATPKILESGAETAAANIALTGDAGFKDGTDVKASLAAAFLPTAIKGLGNTLKLTTKSGRDKLTKEGLEEFATGMKNKDPFVEGEYNQKKKDFTESIRNIFKESDKIIPNRILKKADDKFENIIGDKYNPKEDDVVSNIFKSGMIDGIDKTTNRFNASTGIKTQEIDIKESADLLKRLFSASNKTINSTAIQNKAFSKIKKLTSKEVGDSVNKIRKEAEKIIASEPSLSGIGAKPINLLELSKKLRADAYTSDLTATTKAGTPVDSTRGMALRALANSIDEMIYDGKIVNDIDTEVAKQLRQRQSLAYSTKAVLEGIQKLKASTGVGRVLAQVVGASVGWSAGNSTVERFIYSAIGKILGEKAMVMSTNAFGNKKLSSRIIEEFARNAKQAEIDELTKIVDEFEKINKVTKDKATQETFKKINQLKLKNLIEKTVKDFKENYNSGSKYIPDEKLPVIKTGPKYRKPRKLNDMYNNLDVINF